MEAAVGNTKDYIFIKVTRVTNLPQVWWISQVVSTRRISTNATTATARATRMSIREKKIRYTTVQ